MPLPAMAFTFVTVSVALIAAILLVVYAQSNCYYPNGTDANRLTPQNPQYLPCRPNEPVSMCCHIGDRCRSDGLCLSSSAGHVVWRDFCTDKTWKSPSCVKLCVNGQSIFPHPSLLCRRSVPKTKETVESEKCKAHIKLAGINYGFADRAEISIPVTPCGDGSYCCGNTTASSNCCSNGKGVSIDPSTGDAVSTDPSPSLIISDTQSSATSSVVTSVTVTSAPTQDKSDHTGVIAGSVIAGVVVLAAGGVGAWWFVVRKRRAKDGGVQGLGLGKAGMKYSEMPDSELESIDGRRVVTDARVQGNVELDSGQRHEILDDHTAAVRHELGTSR